LEHIVENDETLSEVEASRITYSRSKSVVLSTASNGPSFLKLNQNKLAKKRMTMPSIVTEYIPQHQDENGKFYLP
jgi:hypothetical protein